MKVAITSTGNDLDSSLDRRFGRCAYFLVVDTENDNMEAIDNSSIAAGGGAGIAAAQQLINRRVDALITGNLGPNAFNILAASGVEVYTGTSDKVSRLLTQFRKGELEKAESPNVAGHHGMR